MRCCIVLLAVLWACPIAAGDRGFGLGLLEMDFSEPAPSPDRLDLVTVAGDTADDLGKLAFRAALRPSSAEERTEALWSSDLGRLHLALAAEHAMLGREGLVNGGRMAGVGLATAGIGDGDPNGALDLVLGRHRWAEMNANQKLRATVEASILVTLIGVMAAWAD